MNVQQNKKLLYKIEKNVLTKQNTEEIIRTKSGKRINTKKENKTKQREEGFSVYLMGANEERIRNLRKKEQIDRMMKNRSNHNSKSIQNRVMWDNKQIEKTESTVEARSKSRQREVNSAIGSNHHKVAPLNEYNKFGDAAQAKGTTSKDSLSNIEDMLSNINLMNKHIASNLNKITVESPGNKRRRNELKYGAAIDYSSTGRDKSQNNSRLVTRANNDLHVPDSEEKEQESKTINVNLRDLKNKASLKNTIDDSSNVLRLVNNKTEAIDCENLLWNESSIHHDPNKSINRNVLNYKVSINERPVSSVMNISNFKQTHENITSPSNVPGPKPTRPYSQIHIRAKERFSNRVVDAKIGENSNDSLIASNLNTSFHRNIQGNLAMNYSQASNVVSPAVGNYSNKHIPLNFNRKNELISKINQFDEKKISKLARLIERLDHIDLEESHEFNQQTPQENNLRHSKHDHIVNKKLNPISKFSNNQTPQDNTNTENNNHYKHDTSMDGENTLKFSLNKFKIDLNCSMTGKVVEAINSKRENEKIVEEQQSSQEQNLITRGSVKKLSKTLVKSNEFQSPRLGAASGLTKKQLGVEHKTISMILFSNYGNPEKIGLTEVQIFDRSNKKINIIDCKSDNENDFGIIKIFNNRFHTIEEGEMWSENFSFGEKKRIEIFYEAIYDIEYITIWNFNGKDLSKGAKDVEILIGSKSVFKGKISKGVCNVKTNYSTTISLSAYSFQNDKYNFDIGEVKEVKSEKKNTVLNSKLEIDTTLPHNIPAAQKTLENKRVEMIYEIEESICSSGRDKKRDSQRSVEGGNSSQNVNHPILYNNISRSQASLTIEELSNMKSRSSHHITCNSIKVYLTANWGDPNYVGLTGIDFLDEKMNVIPFSEYSSFDAMPRDMNSYFGECGDIRVLENLFDGEVMVNDFSHMWLTIFNKDEPPFLLINFEKTHLISGIRIWNYNKKYELDRGVRSIELQFDDHLFYEHNINIRKGVGEEDLNYSQTILFPVEEPHFLESELEPFKEMKPASLRIKQDFDTPYLPAGYVFKITLLSNWGDSSYIGLSDLELFDQTGLPLLKSHNPRIIFYPNESLREYEGKLESPRSHSEVNFVCQFINTKSKDLIDSDPNAFFILFEKPVAISVVKFTNYSKNPVRGVKEVLIHCDDSLIYKGTLKKSERLGEDETTCVFFTSDQVITNQFEDRVYSQGFKQKNYDIFQNEDQIYISMKDEDMIETEGTVHFSNEK